MKLLSIQIGKSQPLAVPTPNGTQEVRSAIRKTTTEGPVRVELLGLVGDEQTDLSVHGGLSKAVYAYPIEHYPFWQAQREQLGFDDVLPHGSMGENLTLQGLLEIDVYVGDELHFPDCVLRVTEPRQPCFKFNAVMGDKLAAKKMLQNGLSGFYLAVVKTGTLSAGQCFTLIPGTRETSIASLNQSHAKKADKAEE